jgi:hypothetical protein
MELSRRHSPKMSASMSPPPVFVQWIFLTCIVRIDAKPNRSPERARDNSPGQAKRRPGKTPHKIKSFARGNGRRWPQAG